MEQAEWLLALPKVGWWVTVAKAGQDLGYTTAALQRKIDTGVLVEGKHWVRGPDRRRHINVIEFQRWIVSEYPELAAAWSVSEVAGKAERGS